MCKKVTPWNRLKSMPKVVLLSDVMPQALIDKIVYLGHKKKLLKMNKNINQSLEICNPTLSFNHWFCEGVYSGFSDAVLGRISIAIWYRDIFYRYCCILLFISAILYWQLSIYFLIPLFLLAFDIIFSWMDCSICYLYFWTSLS